MKESSGPQVSRKEEIFEGALSDPNILEEENFEKKFEELLEKKLPEILAKTEELKKKREEEKKERHTYVEKIWKYFPGAKTKKLSLEEAREIAEKLEELANKVQYVPAKPKEVKIKFFGDKGRKRRIAMVIVLGVVIVVVAVSKFLGGWW